MYFSCMSDDLSSDTQSPPKELNAITPWRWVVEKDSPRELPEQPEHSAKRQTQKALPQKPSGLSAITALNKTTHPSQGSHQRLTASQLEKELQAPLPSHAGASAGLLLHRFCVCSRRHLGRREFWSYHVQRVPPLFRCSLPLALTVSLYRLL